jgi:hypothetical protein
MICPFALLSSFPLVTFIVQNGTRRGEPILGLPQVSMVMKLFRFGNDSWVMKKTCSQWTDASPNAINNDMVMS